MKSISKLFFALLISFTFLGSAFAAASAPSYGLNKSQKSDGKYSEVFLVNTTPETYTVESKYPFSGRFDRMGLGRSGSITDTIKYPIDYPDNQVCLKVIQNNTGLIIFQSCVSYGTYYIHYYGENKSIKVDTSPN